MHARLHRLDRRSHSRLRHLHRAAHQLGIRLNVLRAFHSKNHRLGMRGVVLPDEPGVADACVWVEQRPLTLLLLSAAKRQPLLNLADH